VVMVCADPDSATPGVLGVTESEGLAEILVRRAGSDTARTTCEGLDGAWLVTPGVDLEEVLRDAPAAGLGAYLKWLVEQGFLVVLETPPAAPGVTGLEVARLADLTVLVAELDVTRIPDLQQASLELELAGARVLGVQTLPRLTAPAVPAAAATALQPAT